MTPPHRGGCAKAAKPSQAQAVGLIVASYARVSGGEGLRRGLGDSVILRTRKMTGCVCLCLCLVSVSVPLSLSVSPAMLFSLSLSRARALSLYLSLSLFPAGLPSSSCAYAPANSVHSDLWMNVCVCLCVYVYGSIWLYMDAGVGTPGECVEAAVAEKND